MDRDDWNRRYAGADLVWTAEPNRFLADQVADLPPGRALDLACGEGRNAVWLASLGWDVTAVDFADVALDKGRRLAAERGVDVTWVEGDVRRWAAPSRYDLVVVLYLHLPPSERDAVVAAAGRAVEPAGTLLLVGHDRTNLERGVGGPRDPAILHDADELVGALAGVEGLAVVRAGPVERPVVVDGHERVAIDTLVRARRAG